MIADTHDELMEMAARIGVSHRWLQSPGNHGEHFDICKSKRALAVRQGAAEITWADCARRCHERRSEEARQRYFAAPASSTLF
jgi:hypothetical protein